MLNDPEITVIKKGDKLYPKLLNQIPDAPDKLFVMGDLAVLDQNVVAIVGSRKPTDYGIQSATHFARGLARDLVIISGLAYGIDTIALKEALATKGLPPVAVIGSGLDRESFYPQANWGLALKIIAAGGAIISEYSSGTSPLKYHFPARNRIIAGLSKGVLVVEAAERSGALITADLALDYNREVLAVSGSIFVPQAAGVNQLIKSGAHMVTTPVDIFNVLNIEPKLHNFLTSESFNNMTELELNIFNSLVEEALSIDDIARKLQLDSAKVSSTLTLMEINGMVRSTSTGKFNKL